MYKRKELCTSGRIKLPHRTVPADSKKHQITNQTAIIVTVTVTGNSCIDDYRRGMYILRQWNGTFSHSKAAEAVLSDSPFFKQIFFSSYINTQNKDIQIFGRLRTMAASPTRCLTISHMRPVRLEKGKK